MISDYGDIVSSVKLTGDRKQNPFGSLSVISNQLPDVEGILEDSHDNILFLDIETTGLNGADQPLFLIGLLMYSGGSLVCTQLLAREPSEESAVLLELLSHLHNGSTVMTFNGDSFDIPYIQRRMSYCRITLPEINSVDLLKPARKRYSKNLASCSLQSLERHILNLSEWNREDDIPGGKIPRVYWDFVNNGDYDLITPIIKHNIMDLLSTARLWSALLRS